LRWALGVFPQHDAWRQLQRSGMQQDHSWDSSARAYVKVYERARAGN
jgi:glycogen synthase